MATLDQCFNRMKENKMVRVKNEQREAIAKVMNYTKSMVGQWFFIQSVECDNRVTLCSNTHFIMKGVSIEMVIIS